MSFFNGSLLVVLQGVDAGRGTKNVNSVSSKTKNDENESSIDL